jgi:hypothetical protein
LAIVAMEEPTSVNLIDEGHKEDNVYCLCTYLEIQFFFDVIEIQILILLSIYIVKLKNI